MKALALVLAMTARKNSSTGSAHPGRRGHIQPLGRVENLESRWRELESCADCSFFQSWSWIGTWIAQAKDTCNLHVYQLNIGELPIALGIIGIDNHTRRSIIRSVTVTLNDAADTTQNMFIEYNGLLVRRGHELPAWETFLRDLCTLPNWDELRFTNIPESRIDAALLDELDLHAVIDSHNPPWIASLNSHTDIDSILATLNRERRWQLRRSLKEYEKEGLLSIDAAQSTEQALAFFDEMGVLHSRRWQKAGKSGAFVRDNWVAFHRELIRAAFDRGEIQLLRIRCGERDVGFIYNFIWRGNVLVLQTGFAVEDRNALRPGYVSHMLAMQFNARQGATRYDFMIGDAEYKRALAKPCPPLVTVRLQRRRLKFRMEALLYKLVRAMRNSPPAEYPTA
jgi:CelD/BcsL family acetyltransferase involved in cellulose biosynthesis